MLGSSENWKARPAQLLSLPQPRSRDMSRLLPRAQRQPSDHNASAPVPPGPLPPSWVQAWSWALVLTRASFSSVEATYPTPLPSPLRCWPGSSVLTSVLTLGSLSRKPFLGTCSLYLNPLCFFSSVIQKSGCINTPADFPLVLYLWGQKGWFVPSTKSLLELLDTKLTERLLLLVLGTALGSQPPRVFHPFIPCLVSQTPRPLTSPTSLTPGECKEDKDLFRLPCHAMPSQWRHL